MSVPKQLTKRMKLEKKRLRKRETRHARQKSSRAADSYGIGFSVPPGVVCGPVGGLKMSDVMSDFVAPVLDGDLDRSGLVQLYSMAQTAWNIALEPQYRHGTMIEDAMEAALNYPTVGERELCREFLRSLVARKLEYFAKYQRPILAFQIDDLEDGGYYLSVISGLIR